MNFKAIVIRLKWTCDMESIMPISLIHINPLYSPCLKIAPCCFKQ